MSENRPQAKGIDRKARLALESPVFGILVGHVYRTCVPDSQCTLSERQKGRKPPSSYPFGVLGYDEPVHHQSWLGQRLVM